MIHTDDISIIRINYEFTFHYYFVSELDDNFIFSPIININFLIDIIINIGINENY